MTKRNDCKQPRIAGMRQCRLCRYDNLSWYNFFGVQTSKFATGIVPVTRPEFIPAIAKIAQPSPRNRPASFSLNRSIRFFPEKRFSQVRITVFKNVRYPSGLDSFRGKTLDFEKLSGMQFFGCFHSVQQPLLESEFRLP